MKSKEEEVNQELPYYEELRQLYQDNRQEYNRIARLSLRSRTGRTAHKIDGAALSDSTLVFLKTNFRKMFFLVSDEVKELSVIEALSYFKAEVSETSVPRIKDHHLHVTKALMQFSSKRNLEIQSVEESKESGNLGVQVNTAVNLLKSFMNDIPNEDLRLQINQLKSLVERGVITYIAKRLQRIHKDLGRTESKAGITYEEALSEVVEMAKKYAPYYIAKEAMINEQETTAKIILSESFA